ncbi:unnamed protein product, partial [Laminaria digitata]
MDEGVQRSDGGDPRDSGCFQPEGILNRDVLSFGLGVVHGYNGRHPQNEPYSNPRLGHELTSSGSRLNRDPRGALPEEAAAFPDDSRGVPAATATGANHVPFLATYTQAEEPYD